MMALLQDLGSRAGNRALASVLAPTVQRRGGGGVRDRAIGLLPPGAQPIEVSNLAVALEFFGDMAARRLVRWARPALTDKEMAIEVGTYLADVRARPGPLTWALATEAGDPARLRALLAVMLERTRLEAVQWAWALGGGDRARTEAYLAYDDTYRAGGAKVHGLARKALADAGGDIDAAVGEMTSLAKYDHDPELRAWAGSQAAALAAEEVEARKAAAEQAHTTSVASLGPDTPHAAGTKKLAKWKVTENKQAKKANDEARAEFAEKKEADVAAAAAAEPALAGAAQVAMEDFLAQSRAAKLAPADSAWILQRAGGRADLAAALRPLFGPGPHEPRGTADWVLARAATVPAAQRLVTGLLEAVAGGLDQTAARILVGLPAWLDLAPSTARALSHAVGTSPGELGRAVQWLTAATSLPEAAGLLTTWHAKSGTLGQFLDVAEATEPDRLAWLVGHIGAQASASAVKSLQTALAQGLDATALEPLLKLVSPAQAEQLIDKVLPDKGVIDPRLFTVLKKATATQVTTWIATHGHGVHHLHRWLVDKKWSPVDLDPLMGWAPPTHLPFLLEDDTPATLAPLMTFTPGHLYDLRTLALKEKEVGKYAPSLAIVAGADAVKGAWNKGTFADPLHSVVYHYCKHVRDVGRNESVAQYSADALSLWVNHGPGFNWNNGKKIQVAAGGGLYTTAGQPYSFWY